MSPANLTMLQQTGAGLLTCNIDEGAASPRPAPVWRARDIQFHSGPVLFFDEGLGAPQVHGTVIAVSTASRKAGARSACAPPLPTPHRASGTTASVPARTGGA
jgi:hypothetical protein